MKIQSKKIIFIFLVIITSVLAANHPVIHRPPERHIFDFTPDISRDEPSGDEVVNPAEFGRTDGIFLAWAGWDTQLIADIAYHISQSYTVFMMVTDSSIEAEAFNFLQSQNVNMENVIFLHDDNVSNTSMWIRDYGPFFIKEDGTQAIDDFFYGTYPGDDLISYTIADSFNLPIYDSPLMHHGGNHISDGNGLGFFSKNIYNYNLMYSQAEINEEVKNFFGFDSLVVVEPMVGDGSGHIDMFCKLLSDTLFIVGEYDESTVCCPGDRELLNELAETFSSLTNSDGRQFAVERIPMGPYTYGGPAGTINYTYTNSLIVNDLVLVPIYGFDLDAEVLQIYQELLPDHEIIGINSSEIIQYWGAVHCVTNEYFSENPLIILHGKIEQIESGSEPVIRFRLNPKFIDSAASLFYKPVSAGEFIEVEAILESGIWRAQLPQITENFEYYLSGTAISGEFEFVTTLPEISPNETFYVECYEVSTGNDITQPITNLMNYPNPFNPSTIISFTVSYEINEQSELIIYNIRGQKVKDLSSSLCHPEFMEGRGESRQYSVTWNGTDQNNQPASSGLYFYKLKVNDKTALISKMLLLK